LSGQLRDNLHFGFGSPVDNGTFGYYLAEVPGLTNNVRRSTYSLNASLIPDDQIVWNSAVPENVRNQPLYANIIEVRVDGTITRNDNEWLSLAVPSIGENASHAFLGTGSPESGAFPRAVGVIAESAGFQGRVSIQPGELGHEIIQMQWPALVGEHTSRDFDTFRIAIITTAPIVDFPQWLRLRDACVIRSCRGYMQGGVCSLMTCPSRNSPTD
jgi:hypothetical protein